LTGTPVELGEGSAVVELEAVAEMVADDSGLIHGGFVFGLADHAAMLAINHPNVVLAGAEVQFLAPVVIGDRMRSRATVGDTQGRRRLVDVVVTVGTRVVFTGRFAGATPERHVLAGRAS
jgi:acyl-coenzyme A thioesterase PaaI-like protein